MNSESELKVIPHLGHLIPITDAALDVVKSIGFSFSSSSSFRSESSPIENFLLKE